MIRIIHALSEIGSRYRTILCDVWGVVHDGVAAFPAAVAALSDFRAGGGRVALLTNSPRPSPDLVAQLDALGVPRSAWDVVATSGDATQEALAAGLVGRRIHHVGPDRDRALFTRTAPDIPRPDVELVPLREAEGIVCTGLNDDSREGPEDYRALVLEGVSRGLPMLCANPDIVVDRGARRIWCAGAIARDYAAAGGRVLSFGKPHAPIYTLARRRLDAIGAETAAETVLAAGDGIETDIAGGIGEGLDTLFVAGGLSAGILGPGPLDPARLEALFAPHGLSPVWAIDRLR